MSSSGSGGARECQAPMLLQRFKHQWCQGVSNSGGANECQAAGVVVLQSQAATSVTLESYNSSGLSSARGSSSIAPVVLDGVNQQWQDR